MGLPTYGTTKVRIDTVAGDPVEYYTAEIHPGTPTQVDDVDDPTPSTLPISTSSIPNTPDRPTIADIDMSGAPGSFVTAMTHTTTWPAVSVTIPAVPALHVPEQTQLIDPDNLTYPTAVTGSATIPSYTADTFSHDYEDDIGQVFNIPNPPNIVLTAFSDSVPEFSLDPSAPQLDWTYATYTSTLLTFLKTKANNLLSTSPIIVGQTMLTDMNDRIWDSPEMEMRCRGIKYPQTRWISEITKRRDAVSRRIDIAEADLIERNKDTYLKHRQALEDLELHIYDMKAEGRLAYAKAFAENAIAGYHDSLESWNRMIEEYRRTSSVFLDQIENEKARLAKYKSEVEEQQRLGAINQELLSAYNAQLSTVETIIKNYEQSMRISKAIANITLLSAEIDRLNIESFILRTKALLEAHDAELYRRDTILMGKDTIRADIEYARAVLMKSKVQLEREIGMIDEDLQEATYGADKQIANIMAEIQRDRATNGILLANQKLIQRYYNAEEERSAAIRRINSAVIKANAIIDSLETSVDVFNDKVGKDVYVAKIGGKALKEQFWAANRTAIGELEGTVIVALGDITQKLTHTIVDSMPSGWEV